MEGEMKHYNDDFDYILYDDGYAIIPTKSGSKITQRGAYGKIFDKTKSYEENCIMQIEEIIKNAEEAEKTADTTEKLRADIDFMALMLDVALPSEDEEEGE